MKKSTTHVSLALPAFMQSKDRLFDTLEEAVSFKSCLTGMRTRQGLQGEAMLYHLLCDKLDNSPPYAALSALGSGLQVGKECWLRIDPVELMVDAGNICLVGRDHLLLEKIETQQLLASLNSLLCEDNLEILSGSNQEWYLRLPSQPGLSTFLLSDAIAKDIKPYLPFGNEEKWWNKLITELQMILFQHQVNEERQKLRKPLINSVWIWGEGRLKSVDALKSYQHIWSDDSLLKGINEYADKAQLFSPSSHFTIDRIEAAGHYLISINHHQQGLPLVTQVVQSLFNSLQQRKINELTIYFGDGNIHSYRAPRKFFKFLK